MYQLIILLKPFTQALAHCDVFMNILVGFIIKDCTLGLTSESTKLNTETQSRKTCLHQAGNKWFNALHQSLFIQGLTQISYDPCYVFIQIVLLL